MTIPNLSAACIPFLQAVAFICACLNMLAAGSVFLFGLYSFYFTHHLGYTQVQISTTIALGEAGMYGVGPICGFMADRVGPRLTSLIAGFLFIFGYCLLSLSYSTGVERVKQGQSPTHFLLMALCLGLVGAGCSASYMAAYTAVAKNSKQIRGIAIAILTLISQQFFMIKIKEQLSIWQETLELDVARFLFFLGIAGGLINGLAAFGLKIVPEPRTIYLGQDVQFTQDVEVVQTSSSYNSQQSGPIRHNRDERTPLLQDDQIQDISTNAHSSPNHIRRHEVIAVSGKDFFLDKDAQAFFATKMFFSGVGLMIIYSITAMVDAVARSELSYPSPTSHTRIADDKSPIASIRAANVALISISSYIGRMISVFGSDIAIRRYGAHRIYFIPAATVVMALAQIVGMFASLNWFYLCSILAGLAYGGFFGVANTIVAELWGTEVCGQNW
ncbi:putative monocarboxylate transporter mch1 [Lobosporangium transversale]|uniref:Major facilitator superfamily domain-containing protein n=1 Tax=Lobosporangium transversale TaxID=64571 RepID=A0A1Y2GEM3_9FUNG|nr:major facilitator superfamily domain-containing protein [Lobosporangium transversale]KAF9917211.1 putative monocarboxylate transporter mch1 [Lobosporangium transversale]ORZ08774.1 major facilitator superfamily domain-containing protein [Lobosporangium transversale]|eukprot:XP_021878557.1 major facilitator superfamily domain-containing protein [Lobosporangium transversale]